MSLFERAHTSAAAVASAAAIFLAASAPAHAQDHEVASADSVSTPGTAVNSVDRCPANFFSTDVAATEKNRSDRAGAQSASIDAKTAAHQNGSVRMATINAQLVASEEGELIAQLENGEDERAKRLAATLQTQRPKVVALTGFDYDEAEEALKLFQERYLAEPQDSTDPIQYRYTFVAPVNAGVDSGSDLNHDGTVGGPEDAFGHGKFPGQGGMVLLSQLPIKESQIRTFTKFKWEDMPNNHLSETKFTSIERKVMPLMSRSLWEIPVVSGRDTISLVVTHFSVAQDLGEEQAEQGRRLDQLQFLDDFLSGGDQADYIVDDEGRSGGIASNRQYVVLGQLNADPTDDKSQRDFLRQHAAPGQFTSEGANTFFRSSSDYNSTAITDLRPQKTQGERLNYVLAKRGTTSVVDAGVFWPNPAAEEAVFLPEPDAAGITYRLVWADLSLRN
ncbi:endonuclease/exonuclease/phosphatase family protein [Micrococcoides hystricis]|uniref:Endonuclease/exonuclease/phosphatase family protein n=1 Tax=Micrococcoides hystricis TaxID=1572761 RepID=A0ABV6PAH6_9MICC